MICPGILCGDTENVKSVSPRPPPPAPMCISVHNVITPLPQLTGSLVSGGDIDDAVGVDVESDFDLGNSSGRRRDSDESELTQDLIV